MSAAQGPFSNADEMRRVIDTFIAEGLLDPAAIDREDPLGFLFHSAGASSTTEAGYRFARHQAGCQVILTGTGNVDHLRDNIVSINSGPLPTEDRERLISLFGHLERVSEPLH
jgi:aryl-alcohol dehydrogenase-like predicted oxidoreductase